MQLKTFAISILLISSSLYAMRPEKATATKKTIEAGIITPVSQMSDGKITELQNKITAFKAVSKAKAATYHSLLDKIKTAYQDYKKEQEQNEKRRKILVETSKKSHERMMDLNEAITKATGCQEELATTKKSLEESLNPIQNAIDHIKNVIIPSSKQEHQEGLKIICNSLERHQESLQLLINTLS